MAVRRVKIEGENVASNMGGRRKPCQECGEAALLTRGDDGVERCGACATRKRYLDKPVRSAPGNDEQAIREAIRNDSRRK